MDPHDATRSRPGSAGHRLLLLTLTLAALFVLSGCSGDAGDAGDAAPDGNNGFVGTVEGTNAFIAVVVADAHIAAYVCDGDAQISEYFWGPADGATALRLKGANGALLQAAVTNQTVAGEVTLTDGSTHAFTATTAAGDAGLYYLVADDTVDPDLAGGWVLDNDGNQRGAVTRRSRFEPTPRLTDTGVRIAGTSFAVARIAVSGGGITASQIIAPNNVAVAGVARAPNPPAPFVPIPLPNIGTASPSR
jgi:hypothetical protein